MEALGYHVYMKSLTPLTFGVPQNRPRLYFLAFRSEPGDDKAGLWTTLDSAFQHMEEGHELMDIDNFLYKESDPKMRKLRAQQLERIGNGEINKPSSSSLGGRWVGKQMKIDPGHRPSHWRPELAKLSNLKYSSNTQVEDPNTS